MKKLLLAFFLVSGQLVFAPTVEVEQELTAVQQAIKQQLMTMLEDTNKDRERETELLQKLRMTHRFGDAERKRIAEISARLGLQKDWIYLIIHKESRGNHQAVNRHSGATGLIQFIPKTAKSLGTTTTELLEMTALEQLDYVEKYFERVTDKYSINSYHELYLSVFYPKAMGESNAYVIGPKGSRVVSLNKGVDVNNDGIITVGDFKEFAD